MLGAPLIWDAVVQVRESREKGLLTATGMVKPFHGKELPLDGVMGLIQERAGHRHLGGCKDGIPARLLLLYPAPHTLAVRRPSRGGDVSGKAPSPLPQRKHPPARALARPVQQGVERRA